MLQRALTRSRCSAPGGAAPSQYATSHPIYREQRYDGTCLSERGDPRRSFARTGAPHCASCEVSLARAACLVPCVSSSRGRELDGGQDADLLMAECKLPGDTLLHPDTI